MTTATKNTVTLAELLEGKGRSITSLNDLTVASTEVVQHDGNTNADGTERSYDDINYILGPDLRTIPFPSCFKARETAEWKEVFEIALPTIQAAASPAQGLTDTLGLTINRLANILKDVGNLNEWMGMQFARQCVLFWGLTDAFMVAEHGSFIEEGETGGFSMAPISENVFGVGGREFADDLWDFIVVVHQACRAESMAEQKSKKPESKAAKRKAAFKARKASKKK
jgi:hypothetical protein